MHKTRICIVTIGHMPANLKIQKIKAWKSSIFEIVGEIENFALAKDSDGPDWEFSDAGLKGVLPNKYDADFMIALVTVKLQDNWYTRRLDSNRVVFSFYEINLFLSYFNVPLENAVYRLLYAYTFAYRSHENRIPVVQEKTNFAHDETRGCLFDMNPLKMDIIYSCHMPIICAECVEKLSKRKVSKNAIRQAQKEIRKIQKPLFYVFAEFVKKHPIVSIIISSAAAIVLDVIGSAISSSIFHP